MNHTDLFKKIKKNKYLNLLIDDFKLDFFIGEIENCLNKKDYDQNQFETFFLPSLFEDIFLLDFELVYHLTWVNDKGDKINKKHIRLFIQYIIYSRMIDRCAMYCAKLQTMDQSDERYDIIRILSNKINDLTTKCYNGVIYKKIIEFIS